MNARSSPKEASMLNALLGGLSDAVLALDAQGRILMANAQLRELWQIPADTACAGPVDALLQHLLTQLADPQGLLHEIAGLHESSENHKHLLGFKDGRTFELASTALPDYPGGGRLWIFRDWTDQQTLELQRATLDFHDGLTGLPSRRLFLDRLQRGMIAGARSGHCGALLMIDLDHFKALTSALGHDQGDSMLQQVAERLAANVRDSDTVARLGGDQFVILLEGLSPFMLDAATRANAVCKKLLATFDWPFEADASDPVCTASAGIVLFQGNNDPADELMQRADLAMFQAKAAGRNTIRFFDGAVQTVVNTRVTLEEDLRHALQHDEFHLSFQPQTDVGRLMTGAEALLRWQHPRRGLLLPAHFLSLAEETGHMLTLGKWLLEAACTQLARWGQTPATAVFTMAVNISGRQFFHPDFVEQVQETLSRTGADPERLVLELTESVLLTRLDDAFGIMKALKSIGVSFSLDDFGTGYSSLTLLKRLPLKQVKIDVSVVHGLMQSESHALMARSILSLGNCLGLEVVAEGVETEEQLDFLTLYNCNTCQGHLFSQPLTADELGHFISARL